MGKWGGVMEILKFIRFKDMNDFSVKSYFTNTIQSKFNIISLQKFIIEQNQKVKPFDFPEQDFPILGVDNKVGIFDAYIQKGKEINQPYKIMKNDFLAYNPYRINVGSIGLKKENHKHQYISPAYVVFSCLEELYSEYLFLLFKTNTFNKIINESTTGSVRQNLSFNILSNIKIPLPDIDIQKSLVSAYQEKIKQAEILENQAKQIDDEIEQYLFDSLGVQIEQSVSQQKQDILQFVAFKELEKWSVKDTNNITAETVFLSKKYSNEPLTNYFLVNPSTSIPKDKDISFIPMANISDEYGEIMSKEINKLQNNYTRFQENDLLWAKITPCMQNGKSAIANDLLNGFGFGSTEFHILRIKNSGFDIRLLHLLLRSKRLLTTAMTYFTGSAGQQRVPKSFLESLTLPIISNDEQIAIINHIYNIKNAQKQAKTQAKILREQAIEEFEKAVFE